MVMGMVAQAGTLPESGRCSLKEKWEKQARYFLQRISHFLSIFHPGNFLSQLWAVSGLWHPISVCPRPPHCPEPTLTPCTSAAPTCLVLLGKEFQGSAGPGKPTFVPYRPVPRVPLNKSQRLPCLAATRAVCFFHMVWALCLYFIVSVFLPFLCMQLETESLPTRENCSDALKRVWIPFWKRYSKFFQNDCWWEGQNQQNNNNSKHSGWGRNFCLYNLESDKIQETSQRTLITSVCNSIKLWFSSITKRDFTMLLTLLRYEKRKQRLSLSILITLIWKNCFIPNVLYMISHLFPNLQRAAVRIMHKLSAWGMGFARLSRKLKLK